MGSVRIIMTMTLVEEPWADAPLPAGLQSMRKIMGPVRIIMTMTLVQEPWADAPSGREESSALHLPPGPNGPTVRTPDLLRKGARGGSRAREPII